MGNKTRTTNYEILDKMLADDKAARRNGANGFTDTGENAEGAWVTSKEQFDQLYKSVGDLEKYLRS